MHAGVAHVLLGAMREEPSLPLRWRGNTPCRGLGLARGLATIGGLALVDAAGETVDQPDIVVVRRIHSDEPGADGRNQRGQQDRRRDHARADQYRYRAS